MSFVENRIYARFTRRNTVAVGVSLLIFVAVLAYVWHPDIWVVLVYSALIGVAVSLYVPAVGSAIIDCFHDNERAALSGAQSSFASGGGILFSFVGGLLAAIS